ncbi:MAG: TIGR02186 family protein [Pseudomonadota bacterium]
MIRALCLLIATVGLLKPALAEEIVAGLSQDSVAITANFDGSEILVFGAISREAPPPGDSDLHVIVTVAGPDRTITVRRKARRFGIWVNTEAAEIDAAPTFYAVATTGPLSEIVTATEDLRHRISIPRAIRAVGLDVAAPGDFTEALMRIRRNEGTYRMLEGAVQLRENTLFDTAIALPANLVEGDYETRIFLVREGAVVAQFQTEIAVRKVGLERIIFTLAHERPLIYGILSLIIAIAAGWGASAAFQLLRR